MLKAEHHATVTIPLRYRYNPFQDAEILGVQVVGAPMAGRDYMEMINNTIALDDQLNDSRAAAALTEALLVFTSKLRARYHVDANDEVLELLFSAQGLEAMTANTSCAREVQKRGLQLTGIVPTDWTALQNLTDFKGDGIQDCLSSIGQCRHGVEAVALEVLDTRHWYAEADHVFDSETINTQVR